MSFHPLAWLRRLSASAACRVLDTEMLFRQAAERLGVASFGCSGDLGFFQSSVRDGVVLPGYMRDRTWAPEVQRVLQQVLARGGTFIDAGANIGLTSIPIARTTETCCYAFEPDPDNFRFLLSNIAANGAQSVRPFNLALMAEDGQLTLERSRDNMGDHRIRRGDGRPGAYDEERRAVVRVEGKRLDAVLGAEALKAPVILKVDTQGAEVQVLRGAAGLLAKVDLAILEFWPYGLRRLGDSPQDFYDLISAFPFGGILRDGPVELMPTSELVALLRQLLPQEGTRIDHADVIVSRANPIS